MSILDSISRHYTTDYTRLDPTVLQKSGFDKWCQKYIDKHPTDSLENIFRQVIFEQIMLKKEDVRGKQLAALLDCITYESSAEKPLVEQTLTLALVEDIFDIHTVDWCRHFWTGYLVSREEQLMSVSRDTGAVTRLSGRRAPGTTLIRLANALLRRVSKSRDAVFAGEILIFLSRAFPLSERSGLNQKGEFNVENITIFEGYEGAKEDKEEDDDDDDEDEDEDEEMDGDDKKTPVKEATPLDSPYALFWGLQKYLADPNVLLNSKEPEVEMQKLQTCLKATIKTLRTHDGSAEVVSVPGSRWAKRENRDAPQTSASREQSTPQHHHSSRTLNAKWLTNPDLFTLQLSDTNFRRAIWTQLLIFSEFMLSLTEKNKAKISATASNRSVQYPYTLSASNEAFFEGVVGHFESTSKHKPPYKPGLSPDFNMILSRIIRHVFEFDGKWVEWKLENCPAYEKPVMKSTDEIEGVEELLKNLGHVRPRWRYEMGSEPLTKLWAVETGLSKLSYVSQPDPQSYIDKLTELGQVKKLDWDFLDDAEKAKCEQDTAAADWLGWRAARVSGLWSKMAEATVLNEVVNGASTKTDTRESVDIEEEVEVEAVQDEAEEEESNKRPLEETDEKEGTPSKKAKKDEDDEEVVVEDSPEVEEKEVAEVKEPLEVVEEVEEKEK